MSQDINEIGRLRQAEGEYFEHRREYGRDDCIRRLQQINYDLYGKAFPVVSQREGSELRELWRTHDVGYDLRYANQKALRDQKALRGYYVSGF